MSTLDIQGLVDAGRSLRLDWLAPDATVPQISETMIAMANSAGGTLLLGIDGTTITGVSDVEEAADRLVQAALAIDPPLIIPIPRSARHEDRTIVMAQIPTGMPNVYAYAGRFIRREDTANVPLTPRDLRHLMLVRGEISFETEITRGASLDDIDWKQAERYVEGLGSIGSDDVQQVLLKRGCLARQGDKLRPTNAGILLFGTDPQRFILGSDIAAVRFPGEGMGDTFNRQDLKGPLPEQVKRAETFLFDTLRKSVQLQETMARSEQYEYPMEAARELVINAVAHRDYSIGGDNIKLFIFKNRMEVHSPGGLPGPKTIENLKDERFSRNPIIVQILSDMNFIERLGYGVDRVMELMQQQNLRAPQFEERSGSFLVVLHNTTDEAVATPPPEADTPVTELALNGLYQGHEINPRQESALAFLLKTKHTRITNSDMKSLFPDVHPETIRRDLADLVSKDILVKMGQKRGSYYVLKQQQSEVTTEKT